jgi:biotin carboxyl carrier protein
MPDLTAADVRKLLETVGDEPIEFCHIRTASYEIVLSADGQDVDSFQRPNWSGPQIFPAPEETLAVAAPATSASRPAVAPSPVARPPELQVSAVAPQPMDTTSTAVTAPMIGIFYRAPNPESPPFVEVGSVVTEDTTVGLIEAMKVFMSVPARVRGVVVGIDVENGEFVQQGATVMRIAADGR